jgi:quercetin dioxygenase-like cupin family protein
MDTTAAQPSLGPRILHPGEGRHLHFLNHLATVKVEGTDADLSVVEFTGARSFGPPLHTHREEDELFVVLEGEIAFMTDPADTGTDLRASAGGIVFLPKGVPHTFQIRSDTARWVCVTGSGSGHPRFDQMVAALGEPTDSPTLPEPGPIDPGQVAAVCAAHGIDIVGPPPAPLD